MSDGADGGAGAGAGAEGGVAGAIAGAAAAGGGDGGGGEQQQQQQDVGDQGARWQDKFLPEELRNDETLAAYKDVPGVARALVETKKWARGRVAVPAAGDAEGFAEFAAKVRPETPDAYEIAGPDGKPTDLTNAMRPIFHEIGLHPHQAKVLGQKWNQHHADTESRVKQEGQDQLTAIELEMGPAAYNQRLAAVGNMLTAAGIEDAGDLANGMTQLYGAGNAMKALFALAEKTGELGKVDGVQVKLQMGNMSVADAQAEVDRMSGDPEIAKKIEDVNSAEYKRRKALLGVIAAGSRR